MSTLTEIEAAIEQLPPVKFRELRQWIAATGAETILVAEVRAAKGEAWFQIESLQLVKLK